MNGHKKPYFRYTPTETSGLKFMPMPMLKPLLHKGGKQIDNWALGKLARDNDVLPCDMPVYIGNQQVGRVTCYNRAAIIAAARKEGWVCEQ